MKRLSALFAAVFFALALASCSKTDEMTYWNIKRKIAAEDDALEYYAVLYSSEVSSTEKIDEIWVNANGFTGDEVTFNVKFGSSDSDGSLKYNAQTDLKMKKSVADATGGWVRLCDGIASTYKYAVISTCDSMHFNEIVFLTEEHKILSIDVSSAGERSSIDHSKKRTYDLDSSADQESENDNLADKIVDEQSAFDFEKVSALYEKAIN